MLAGLFERVGSTAATPRDPQAEAFINDAVRAQPYAPYVLAQTVLVQQQALENASRRLAELEAQARAEPKEEPSFLGSLGKSLFGGGSAPPPGPPPRPSYAPDPGYQRQPAYGAPPAPPQAGPWGGSPQSGQWGGAPQAAAPAGGGFLQSALTTAAGVAGGVVLAHSLGSLFGGNSGYGMGGGFGGGGGGEEIVNNYYEAPAGAGGPEADRVADDQDADVAQDASFDDSGGFDDSGSYDT
jgi:hypothetical protein